jgi:type VI secretion system protein ImpA
MSLDPDTLLEPISSQEPTGEFLLYEGTYDRIREARRADSPELPRDIWEYDLKTADWERVETLCIDALTHQTKDVQIAAWLLEAASHLRGFAGLAEGSAVLLGLCKRFWSDLHPPASEDGTFRAAPFDWLNEKFSSDVLAIPVAVPKGDRSLAVTWNDWNRAIWLENMLLKNAEDPEFLAQVEDSITQTVFTERVAKTPRAFFEAQHETLDLAVGHLQELELLLDEAMGPVSPSLVRLRENMVKIREWTRVTLRTTAPPASLADQAPEDMAEDAPMTPTVPAAQDGPLPDAPPVSPGVFRSRRDAYQAIEQAARYLRAIEPHSPAPYLILRAVAWGEKPLADLIVELRKNGLDLESLSNLLGLYQEDAM